MEGNLRAGSSPATGTIVFPQNLQDVNEELWLSGDLFWWFGEDPVVLLVFLHRVVVDDLFDAARRCPQPAEAIPVVHAHRADLRGYEAVAEKARDELTFGHLESTDCEAFNRCVSCSKQNWNFVCDQN